MLLIYVELMGNFGGKMAILYLQHNWKVLSGLPSDSDLVWTISQTAVTSESEKRRGESTDLNFFMYFIKY